MGIVAENGPGASKFAVGQRVVGAPWPFYGPGVQGTWAQFAVISEADLLAVPDSLSDKDAGQFYVS